MLYAKNQGKLEKNKNLACGGKILGRSERKTILLYQEWFQAFRVES